ncbi:hypothetical protein DMB66_45185 [Actinoplanes sp. ATCC 53533]|nr:hypothetical protein DMB66_45185 [Actinoplanes sp. ATCC 53533]
MDAETLSATIGDLSRECPACGTRLAFTLALAKTPEIDTSDPDALVVSAAAKIVSIRDRGRPYGPLLMTG